MELLTYHNLLTLLSLILLQFVLGLDNLLYIAIESKRAKVEHQRNVQRIGIYGAMVLRIVLLFVLIKAISSFEGSVFTIHSSLLVGDFNLHSLIVLFGGVFIIYTATSEIIHMLNLGAHEDGDRKAKSTKAIILSIILMNLIFSFDSILVAMALTDEFLIMAIAIVTGGLIMIFLVDKVASFLKKNRMFEVLGLFILFIVGIMLLSEGGHLAHLRILGNEVTPMSKTTFYFVITTLILVDTVQSIYQKNLRKGKT